MNTENTAKPRKGILVCLSSSTSNARVIHAAADLAAAFRGSLTALFVETPAYALLSEDDKKRLRSNMNLAEKLGARLETVIGDDVPYQIAEYARVSDVSCIVIGQTNTVSRLFRRRKPLTDRLVAYAPDLDYFIIPDHGTRVYVARNPSRFDRRQAMLDSLLFLTSLAGCTLIGFLFSHLGFTDANIIMVYLLGLLIVSIGAANRVFGMVWAVLSVLLFDLLFTTPRFSFYSYETGYPVTFIVMLAAASIISTLAIRLKQNAGQSAKSARRMSVVLETDRQLSKAKTTEEIFFVLASQLTKLLKRSLVIYPAQGDELGDPVFYPAAEDTVPYRTNDEKPAAEWAFRHRRRAGAATDVFPTADYLYYSLRVQERVYGVVGTAVHGSPPDASELSVLASVVGECSLALENARNAREKEESMLLAENERLRANLLRAVSHDLRTPLTSILGNADNLLYRGEALDPRTRKQLYEDIYADAQWLTGMVENLLSASRVSEGKLSLKMSTELMDDMITEGIQHLGRRLDSHILERRKAETLLFVKADARLMVQVIINLVDNAIKYTPSGSRICIETAEEGENVAVRIGDDGPGIPEEEKTHIFDLFYTGGNPAGDNRRGLGIGLALCESILKGHGGSIRVKDNVPKGTLFEFTLPKEEVNLNE
ncbi:MAG: sensor histidine kinase KdpD [Clostridia bacterium]|nr:sensor histidine kinase KdpD [Clostridia bacterium]